ncbi:MAG: hypothetical protein M2R45_05390 [Verrucomicrobia subdivision 3 bacterium]|nr:hypothetical protein [Limisphaerales bacterium]MCS1415959.1 hypothetical protein [Limisphaerales bacterium]
MLPQPPCHWTTFIGENSGLALSLVEAIAYNLIMKHAKSRRQLLAQTVGLSLVTFGLCMDVFAEEKSDRPDLKAKDWKPLFDGESLKGWMITDFAGHTVPKVEDGNLVIPAGLALGGVNVTNAPPKMNFELTLEAKKIDGNDFFCCLTFPYGDSYCSFVVGGWGGGIIGISSVDGMDASENDTTDYMMFEKNRWYRITVRVTPKKIETWIDEDKMVDLKTTGRKISMRFGEIEESVPLGIATWMTSAALRDIRIRKVE